MPRFMIPMYVCLDAGDAIEARLAAHGLADDGWIHDKHDAVAYVDDFLPHVELEGDEDAMNLQIAIEHHEQNSAF